MEAATLKGIEATMTVMTAAVAIRSSCLCYIRQSYSKGKQQLKENMSVKNMLLFQEWLTAAA
jgi:hypothetical protein